MPHLKYLSTVGERSRQHKRNKDVAADVSLSCCFVVVEPGHDFRPQKMHLDPPPSRTLCAPTPSSDTPPPPSTFKKKSEPPLA